MRNGKPKLDWQFDETKSEQNAPSTIESSSKRIVAAMTSPWRWRPYRLVGSLLLLGTVLGFYSYQFYQQATKNVAAIHRTLQTTIDAEAVTWYMPPHGVATPLLDEQAPLTWTVTSQLYAAWLRQAAGAEAKLPLIQIEQMALYGEWARVQVLVTHSGVPWLVQPYREIRFYRIAQGRWRQTAPTSVFWDRPEEIKTRYFIFKVQHTDATKIARLAPTLDHLYATLRQNVGLTLVPSKRLTIEVTPNTEVPLNLVLLRMTRAQATLRTSLASSALTLRTFQLHCGSSASSQGDAFNSAQGQSLCEGVVRVHFAPPAFKLPAPALWPVWVGTSETSTFTQALAALLIDQVLDEVFRQQTVVIHWVPMLQGLHVWLSDYGEWSPLVWVELQHEAFQPPLLITPSAPLLNRVLSNTQQGDEQLLLASSVIAYTVETYGIDTLPTLIAGFSHYDSWQTLIPAVYGTSVNQFERAWQAYVQAHYRSNR